MLERIRQAMRYLGLMTTNYAAYALPDPYSLLSMIHTACLEGNAEIPDVLWDYLDESIARGRQGA